jgi:hypothetical protein
MNPPPIPSSKNVFTFAKIFLLYLITSQKKMVSIFEPKIFGYFELSKIAETSSNSVFLGCE